MLLRNTRATTIIFLCSIWLLLIAGSYRFSQKPPTCFTIDSLPYSIETSGCFKLHSDLSIDDPRSTAILIQSNKVRLDLGGHRITGPSNSMVSGVGIGGHGIHEITIENGIISGFLYGIRIEKKAKRSSEHITLRNVSLIQNTFRGAMIEGNSTVVEHITVERTGGSLFFPDAYAMGLEVAGSDCHIIKNRILETYPVGGGEGIGISIGKGSQRCVIQGNELTNSHTEKNVKTYGILTSKESIPTLLNNKIEGFHEGMIALCAPIQALPYLIDSPGCYELRGDLKVNDPSAVGILIRSRNVHLDLKGHQIIGLANPRGSGIGIAVEGSQNVLIEHGTVSGFLYGLRAEPDANKEASDRITIRKTFFLNNGFRGAYINSSNTIIENVNIQNTGGTLFFPDSFAIGLELSGINCRVLESQVMETYPAGKGEGIGISLSDETQGCRLEKNKLVNSRYTNGSKTFGIWHKGKTEDLLLLNNEIEGFTHPLNSVIYEHLAKNPDNNRVKSAMSGH